MNTKKEATALSFLYLAAFMLLFMLTPVGLNAQNNANGKQVFDVLKYGAKGDGVTLDSPGIQKAIDAATKAGNGSVVLVPTGHRYLVGTIELKNNIDFRLEGDAELYVSTDLKNYINDAVIIANDVKDLKISGTGSINGRALEFMTHYSKETEIYMPATWRPENFGTPCCRHVDFCLLAVMSHEFECTTIDAACSGDLQIFHIIGNDHSVVDV